MVKFSWLDIARFKWHEDVMISSKHAANHLYHCLFVKLEEAPNFSDYDIEAVVFHLLRVALIVFKACMLERGWIAIATSGVEMRMITIWVLSRRPQATLTRELMIGHDGRSEERALNSRSMLSSPGRRLRGVLRRLFYTGRPCEERSPNNYAESSPKEWY